MIITGIVNYIKQFFLGDDVFISYSRLDSTDYAFQLSKKLVEKKLNAFLDQYETHVDDRTPDTVLQKIKVATSFVIIASEGSRQSKAMRNELELFLPTKRNIIVIDVNGAFQEVQWKSLTAGLPIKHESKQAFIEHNPSSDVVERIVNSLKYTLQRKRIQRGIRTALMSLILIVLVIGLVIYKGTKKINEQQSSINQKEKQVAAQDSANAITKHRADSLHIITLLAQDEAKLAKKRTDSLKLLTSIAQNEATFELQKARYYRRFITTSDWIEEASENHQQFILDTLFKLSENNANTGKTIKKSFELSTEARIRSGENLAASLFMASKAKQLNSNKVTNEVLAELMNGTKGFYKGFNTAPRIEAVGFLENREEFIVGSANSFVKFNISSGDSTQLVDLSLGYKNKHPVAISDGGKFLLSRTWDWEGPMHLYDIHGNWLVDLPHHNASHRRPSSFSPSGKIIVVEDSRYGLIMYDQNGTLIGSFKGYSGDIYGIAFSSDEKYIATSSSDGFVYIWNIKRKLINRIKHPKKVWKVAISANGEKILTYCDDKTVRLWSNFGGTEEKIWHGEISSVNFSPDGERILLVERDTPEENPSIIVLEKDGEFLSRFNWHVPGHQTVHINFSLDSKWVISGSDDDVYVWPIDQPDINENDLLSGRLFELKYLKYYYWNMAQGYYDVEKYDKAIKYFEIVNEFLFTDIPFKQNLLYHLGSAYLFDSKPQRGIECLQEALLIKPENKIILSRLGDAFAKIGDTTRAIQTYEKIVDIDPYDLENLETLGSFYNNLKDYIKASRCYKLILEVEPENTRITNLLANLHGNNKNFELAVTIYLQSIKIDTSQSTVWNNLGYFYGRLGQQLKAVKCSKRAISIDPNNANPHAHLGYAHYKLGNLELAKSELSIAQTLEPEYAKTYFYLACYYGRLKDFEKMISNLRQAVEKGFNDQVWIKEESSFDWARSKDDFKEIVGRL